MVNPEDSNSFRCGGRMCAASEIAWICEVVATCGGLSRKERANTISELVGWTRAHGSLRARYTGACYRAANGVEIGKTSGRGHDHRQHRCHGARPKRVVVYPLRRDARARLRGESGRP